MVIWRAHILNKSIKHHPNIVWHLLMTLFHNQSMTFPNRSNRMCSGQYLLSEEFTTAVQFTKQVICSSFLQGRGLRGLWYLVCCACWEACCRCGRKWFGEELLYPDWVELTEANPLLKALGSPSSRKVWSISQNLWLGKRHCFTLFHIVSMILVESINDQFMFAEWSIEYKLYTAQIHSKSVRVQSCPLLWCPEMAGFCRHHI